MNKIFFDANILLDILLPGRVNHSKAIKAYENICDRYDILATSENILTTIEYIANKHGTSCETIGQFFISMQENFEIYSFADILSDSLDIYRQVCKENKKIDFEDLLQLQCAINNSCTAFITQDRGIQLQDLGIDIFSLDDMI